MINVGTGGWVDVECLLEQYGVPFRPEALLSKRIPLLLQFRLYLKQAGLDTGVLSGQKMDPTVEDKVKECLAQAYRDATENDGPGCAVQSGCASCASSCG